MYDEDKKTEDFWDLGKPREKKYAKPDFSGHTIDTTEISDGETSVLSPNEARAEKIIPRGEKPDGDPKASASFWIDPIGGGRITTSSYRRHSTRAKAPAVRDTVTSRRSLGDVVSAYEPTGKLLKKIEIRRWETDTEFYGRFTSDALLSHRSKPSIPTDGTVEPVPYFSYVPQYAHMNRAQVEYYRYVRENIRCGRAPKCDLPYLQLYIYEILNLPDEIPAEEGVRLLSRIWLGYRSDYPRLDGYLCEWLPDYCMISGVPLPDELLPILGEITPKAQFKEFFLDSAIKCGADVGGVVAEVASDYDYKNSRYYADNKELFDKHIPAALSYAVTQSMSREGSVFLLDRSYKMVRDSYCGAVVASNVKRRIDIEFTSFTRRADARMIVTAMVKHAENRARSLAGIKPKLNADKLDEQLVALIDGYFAPLMPRKARPAEDRYMPDDYLRNYEAEDSGFDFDRAADIEKQSWANTERLTGEEFSVPENADVTPTERVDGEIAFDDVLPDSYGDADGAEIIKADENEKISEPCAEGADGQIKAALRAALDGEFGAYCRSVGALDGDVADKVNTRMLDVLGDVALESDGAGYKLIEDYREDIEQWL